MCAGWRRGAPIRCHHTRCLSSPLAGGGRSCAQNHPRCSHSPHRSRAENIIRFERLGAAITSSFNRDTEKVWVCTKSLLRSCSSRCDFSFLLRRGREAAAVSRSLFARVDFVYLAWRPPPPRRRPHSTPPPPLFLWREDILLCALGVLAARPGFSFCVVLHRRQEKKKKKKKTATTHRPLQN